MALAILFAWGLSACGEAETGPVPADRQPGAQEATEGADGCQVFADTVNIRSAADLAQFEGLSCFEVERHLFVQDTTDITDLSALSGLRSTGGFIGIADNEALESVSLPNLEETGEGLVVEGNMALESIEFAGLRHVNGYLHVFNNQALTSASFPWLLGVGDDVIFAGNDALASLDLPRLTCVMGRFIFEHSDGLECLCLPNLVFVNGDFLVYFNGSLRSISAPVLTTVWGDVNIRRNPQLEHVDLSCLDQVAGDFMMVHNRMLAQCEVDSLVGDINTIGGDTVTGDNAQTCPDEPTTAEGVGCASCTTSICVEDAPDGDLPGDDDDLPGDDDDDVGVPDAGTPDAGTPDTGSPDDGGGVPVPPDTGDDDDGPGDDDDDDDDSSGSVAIQSIGLEGNPNSTISSYLNLQTAQPTFVSVTATSGGHTFELNFDEQTQTDHRLGLIGFRADRTYQLDVRAYTPGGAETTRQLTFESGPLPDNFAPLDVTVSRPGRTDSGIILFNLNRWNPGIDGSWSYIVGIDMDGEVVWYNKPRFRAQDVELLENGNIAFNSNISTIFEMNLMGEVVNEWSAEQLGVDYLHHEIHELPNGNLVTLASENRSISGYGEDGNTTWEVVGDIIVEFTRQGQVVRRFSTFDFLDPYRWGVGGFFGTYWNSRYRDEASSTRDWTHGNAVHYVESDDSFLFSARHQDWVMKIDRQTGELIWRLGAEGDFALTDGEWFYHQHDPMITSDGTLMLYDNGNLRPGLQAGEFYSRAVEYSLDETGADAGSDSQGTATQVWEYTENNSFYSAFVSGVDEMPNGNVLIADGARTLDQTLGATDPDNQLFTRIVEVTDDPNPEKVFEVMIRDDSGQYGYTMYRATHYDVLGVAPSF
jgi:hypothetical protein